MLDTRAVVVQTEKNFAMVQAKQQNSCSACEGRGCSSSKVTQLFCNKPREFKVENRINACVGDEVIVSVMEGAVLQGIGLVYLLPLLLLFAGATLAGNMATNAAQRDGFTALGAVAGLLIGFVFARWFAKRRANQLNRPYIAALVRE